MFVFSNKVFKPGHDVSLCLFFFIVLQILKRQGHCTALEDINAEQICELDKVQVPPLTFIGNSNKNSTS